MKSRHSVKSTRSVKSYKSDLARSVTGSREYLQMNFDDFVYKALEQFGCPVSVAVFKETQRDLYFKTLQQPQSKFKRKSFTQTIIDLESSSTEFTLGESESLIDPHTLVVTAHYDFFNRLTDITMTRFDYHPVPRVLIQIIALVAPYNRHLIRFTIKNCRIDMYTIHELSKLIPMTNITELCLDQSPVQQGNYDILLRDVSCLRNLSLARCNINDIVCGRIAARLCFLQPAEKTLTTLNLSSNDITNEGTKSLAEALRTNRHLRYLNLSDNHIEDEGATSILDVLKEFPLTSEEDEDSRKRHVKYLKKKMAAYYKCMDQIMRNSGELTSEKKSKKSMSKKNKLSIKKDQQRGSHGEIRTSVSKEGTSILDIISKARVMSEELLGSFEDPFSTTTTKVKHSQVFSNGNLTLCYLNLAYNNLSFVFTRKLLEVILYQQKSRTDKLCGLIRIILDGNYIPAECDELNRVNEVLKAYYDSIKNTVDRKRTKTSVIR